MFIARNKLEINLYISHILKWGKNGELEVPSVYEEIDKYLIK